MTRGYKRLQEVRWGYNKLQGITRVCRGLKGVEEGYKRVIRGYKSLQGPTGGYKGLQGVTRVSRS